MMNASGTWGIGKWKKTVSCFERLQRRKHKKTRSVPSVLAYHPLPKSRVAHAATAPCDFFQVSTGNGTMTKKTHTHRNKQRNSFMIETSGNLDSRVADISFNNLKHSPPGYRCVFRTVRTCQDRRQFSSIQFLSFEESIEFEESGKKSCTQWSWRATVAIRFRDPSDNHDFNI